MDQEKVVIGSVTDLNKTPVTEHQGIDLGGIKNFVKDLETRGGHEIQGAVAYFKPQILELIEHVENDGLLGRVSQARQDMAAEDAEKLLPSQQ